MYYDSAGDTGYIDAYNGPGIASKRLIVNSLATFAVSPAAYLGISSTSPWGLFSVEQGAETYSFVVSNTGSSTPSLVVRGVNGNGNVGIASSTPAYRLSVNSGSSAFAINDSGIVIQGTWQGTVVDEAYIDWTVTGQVVDFGGATSFELPNASNPTVNATGETAVNSSTATSTAIVFFDGTN